MSGLLTNGILISTADTWTKFYTVPAGTAAVCSLNLCNNTNSAVNIAIAICENEGGPEAEPSGVFESKTVLDGRGFMERSALVIPGGHAIWVKASAANAISASVYGFDSALPEGTRVAKAAYVCPDDGYYLIYTCPASTTASFNVNFVNTSTSGYLNLYVALRSVDDTSTGRSNQIITNYEVAPGEVIELTSLCLGTGQKLYCKTTSTVSATLGSGVINVYGYETSIAK